MIHKLQKDVTINRTILELKYLNPSTCTGTFKTINRTILELKFVRIASEQRATAIYQSYHSGIEIQSQEEVEEQEAAINRTILELKFIKRFD